MAAGVQCLQQRADVDLVAHRPVPGDDGAGRRRHPAQHVASQLRPPGPVAAHAKRRASERAKRFWRPADRGRSCAEPPWPLACASSQGPREQVGTGYRDQGHDRASSREVLIGPGDEKPDAPGSPARRLLRDARSVAAISSARVASLPSRCAISGSAFASGSAAAARAAAARSSSSSARRSWISSAISSDASSSSRTSPELPPRALMLSTRLSTCAAIACRCNSCPSSQPTV